jgi:Flp pilus assembly pilin Flp
MRNKKGQGMIEYIILVALLAIAAIGITELLGQTVRTKLAQITAGLQDRGENIGKDLPTVEAKHVDRKGLSDFHKNTNKKSTTSTGTSSSSIINNIL